MFYLGPVLRPSAAANRLLVNRSGRLNALVAAAALDPVDDDSAREHNADAAQEWPLYDRRQADRRSFSRAPLLDTRSGVDRRRSARPQIDIRV